MPAHIHNVLFAKYFPSGFLRFTEQWGAHTLLSAHIIHFVKYSENTKGEDSFLLCQVIHYDQ